MKTAIITINESGKKLAQKLKRDFKDAAIFSAAKAGYAFRKYDGLVFIAALGITVRLIVPFVKNKLSDPAVVSVDTAGRFAISALSGHEGGANRLAFLVAKSLGAEPVITTGTEAHKKFILGIGARRGVVAQDVKSAVEIALKKAKIRLADIRFAATLDLKKTDAELAEAMEELGLPVVFISQEKIRNFKGKISVSQVARRHLGLDGVCEPCALLAGRRTRLILKKTVLNSVTVAVAEEN